MLQAEMIDNYQFLNPSPKQNVTVPESLTGASRVPFLQNKNKQSFTGLFFFILSLFFMICQKILDFPDRIRYNDG